MVAVSTEVLEQVFDALPDATVLVDNGEIVAINRAAVRLIGSDADARVVGQPLGDLLESGWSAADDSAPPAFDRVRCDDGSTTMVKLSSGPMRVGSRDMHCVQMVAQARASSALSPILAGDLSESSLLSVLPDTYVVFDSNGVIMRQQSGESSPFLTATDPEWQSIAELAPKDIAEKFLRAIHLALRSSKIMTFEYTLLDASRCRDFEARVVRASEHCAVAIIRDITEVKRLEQQEMQRQWLEGIGRLAGGIAHDFNNLLTAVVANTEFARFRVGAQDEQVARHLDQVLAAAERAASLTRELLAFSKSHLASSRIVDMEELTLSNAELVRQILGERSTLNLVLLADGAATVRADPRMLERAIVNMVINARDAMPSGGRLSLAVRTVRVGEVTTRKRPQLKAGEYVMLVIRDTGRGMDRDTLRRAFDPFFTSKRNFDGAGLGLSAAYGIISQFGGTIVALSKPGRGTTMAVYLPRATDTEPVSPTPRKTVIGPLSGVALLAEDDAMVRDATARSLRRIGFTVIEAENGVDALRKVDESGAKIDVLVTDIVMPLMEGRELALRIRERFDDVRILYMSGYTDRALNRADLAIPGTAFLSKPFNTADMHRELQSLLAADG